MSPTSERRADLAGTDAAASAPDTPQPTGVPGGRTVGHPNEPAAGDRLAVRTAQSSGVRSSTGRRSAPAHPAAPGSTRPSLPQLVDDVGNDAGIVDRFVSDYLGLLDQRISTLRRLLDSREPPDKIRVSILSLETTSAMLGATDVVSAARGLRAAVAQQERAGSEMLFDRLLEAVESLRQSLVSQGFTSSPPHRPAAG